MPAVLAGAGTSSLITLAVIAVGAMLLAALFGQLTRRVPNSGGGLYAYAARVRRSRRLPPWLVLLDPGLGGSEVGRLRQATVHRPGLELSRPTPRDIGELLFGDVMWAKRAKEEHDVFAETLRERGVRKHYFGQLLAETLDVPEGRAFVLERMCALRRWSARLLCSRCGSWRRTSTGCSWPSTRSAGYSRPTYRRCGPGA
jgi:hypothetical protein